jgi:hypothetical protein
MMKVRRVEQHVISRSDARYREIDEMAFASRWYKVKGRAPLHADVNGSYNIGRKVFPTAFDCLGIGGTAVRPVRFTGKVSGVGVII